MPRLLVKVHKIVWEKSGLPSFLKRGDIPADCLSDLNTEQNELSVWYIENDGANLNRVLTALAATCGFVSNLDYLIFDYEIVTALGLTITKTDGETPDSVANRSWHRDLAKLSGENLLKFALAIFYDSSVIRIPKKKIGEWLKTALANGELDLKLPPGLAEKILAAPPAPLSRLQEFFQMCREVVDRFKDALEEIKRES